MTAVEIIALVLGSSAAMGILTSLVTTWLKRGDRKLDEATAIRAELREQNAKLMARLDAVEADLVTWKEKYAVLRESNISLRAENVAQAQKIVDMQQEIDKLRTEVADLRTGTGTMRQVKTNRVEADEIHAERVKAKQVEAETLKKTKPAKPA